MFFILVYNVNHKGTEEKKEKNLYKEKGTLGKRRGGRIGEREVLRRGEGIGRLCGERVIERGVQMSGRVFVV